MTSQSITTDLQVLTAAETAALLTVSIPVLDRWRANNEGPRFIRLSARRVGYRLADIRVWMSEREHGGQTPTQNAA